MAKQERIDFRVDETIKTQFTQAAEAFGMTLSTFMIAAAQEQVARAQRRTQAAMPRLVPHCPRPVGSSPAGGCSRGQGTPCRLGSQWLRQLDSLSH